VGFLHVGKTAGVQSWPVACMQCGGKDIVEVYPCPTMCPRGIDRDAFALSVAQHLFKVSEVLYNLSIASAVVACLMHAKCIRAIPTCFPLTKR